MHEKISMCGSCGGSRPVPRANKAVPQPPPNAVQRVAPPGSFNPPDKFCKICGWAIKNSKLPGPNGRLIDQKSCTNRMCQNYR